MRFLIDESTGISVANYLRSEGHDVLAVVESMPQADDSTILERAVEEERILISNDKDFGDLVYRRLRGHKGVVLLRLKEDSARNRVRVMQLLLERYSDRLEDNFTVVTEEAVRIRPILQIL
jgi:predicted nuclease of predicted toxin-antitoxin system